MKNNTNTTTTNKGFRGIRKNVSKTNNSTSVANIERLQKKIMHKKYEDSTGAASFCVIKRININDSGTIEEEMYQATEANPTLLAYGILNKETKSLSVRKIKDKDTGEMYPAKPTNVGPNETYKLYDNIILVNYKNAESRYENHRINGLVVNGEEYEPVNGSNSMSKHSSVYFARVHDNNYDKLNALTGGMLDKVYDTIEDVAGFDELAGIVSRVSIPSTTPMLYSESGFSGNVFYFNASIESAAEQSIEPIDSNHRDGYAVFRDRFTAKIFTELAEEKVTEDQARLMPLQARIKGAAGKENGRSYNLKQMIKEIKGVLELEKEIQKRKGNSVQLCYCWINCKLVDLTTMSEKELEETIDKIDIFADKDVMKWGKYIVGQDLAAPLQVGIVNTNRRTTGRMGSQIAFKMNEDLEEGILYFKALTQRQLATADEKEAKLTFDKDGKLSNTTYFNCLNVNREKAITDKLLNNYKIRQLDKSNLNKMANLKHDINSMYLRLVPEDSLLNDRKEVLGSRLAVFTLATGEKVKVKCLEVYSSAFEREYRKMEKELKKNTKMTKEQKQVVLDNMRISVAIKSPSQGPDEFEAFFFMLAEEIKERGVTEEYLLFIIECPDGCIIVAADNTMKRVLAGSDFDGDDVTVIFCEFTMTDDGIIVTGLYYVDEEGVRHLVNCYVCIVIRKRVRNNNVGIGCLVEYDEDGTGAKPIRYGKEEIAQTTEDNKEEETKPADYLSSLDISDLF